jgi:predicted nucleic acid-binding protein
VILLDTNVISEMMRENPDATVLARLDQFPTESVWTTSITVFEIRHGLQILAAGRARKRLETAFSAIVEDELEGRVLPLDIDAATKAGMIAAECRLAGRSIDIRDALISGIAVARKAAIATRNLKHFADTGVPLINPWSD